MDYKYKIRFVRVDGNWDLFVDNAQVKAEEVDGAGTDFFAIGSAASGGSTTALGILLAASGDIEFAKTLKSEFKWDFVRTWPVSSGVVKVEYEIDLIKWAMSKAGYFLNRTHLLQVIAGMRARKAGIL